MSKDWKDRDPNKEALEEIQAAFKVVDEYNKMYKPERTAKLSGGELPFQPELLLMVPPPGRTLSPLDLLYRKRKPVRIFFDNLARGMMLGSLFITCSSVFWLPGILSDDAIELTYAFAMILMIVSAKVLSRNGYHEDAELFNVAAVSLFFTMLFL